MLLHQKSSKFFEDLKTTLNRQSTFFGTDRQQPYHATVRYDDIAQVTQLPRVNVVGNECMDSGLGVFPVECLCCILKDEGVIF